ncbi:MAG TPA: 4Fe-4S dicluster domain-containing protein [Thermodesulfobacteriota bacterium]|nr:4Fe-4S dicluster domain-containing protein [Thermodesulfobacteriota bacterium]
MEDTDNGRIDKENNRKTDLEKYDLARREFLEKFASGVFASLVAPALGFVSSSKAEETSEEPNKYHYKLPNLKEIELPEPRPNEDVLIRMMRDLQRALNKPIEQRKWVMVIDLRKCIGCHACTVACIVENKLPPGVVYRPVIDEEIGEFPNVARRFVPRPCFQCENPPCTPVCPVKATYKRPDGIVAIDYEKCIGCKYCITACPYGARSYDFGENYTDATPSLSEIEEAPNFEYHRKWKRAGHESPVGNARKCHFCLHRIERGLLPQCVTSCIGRATFFGDKNDPDSLVAGLITKPNVMRLKEELGTEPNVYYLT